MWCGTTIFLVLRACEHFISAQHERLARWLFPADTGPPVPFAALVV